MTKPPLLVLLALSLTFCQSKHPTEVAEQHTLDSIQPMPEPVIFGPEKLKAKKHVINPKKDTSISTSLGTVIKVPENAFVDKNGKPLAGSVEIEIKEALSTLDMVLAKLSTTCNGNPLQSAGMVYLNAKFEQEEVYLQKGKSIELSIPTEKIDQDMFVYSGEVDSLSGEINWVRTTTSFKIPKKEIPKEVTDSIQATVEALQKLEEPEKPIHINQLESVAITPNLEFRRFPELKRFDNVSFKVVDTTQKDLHYLAKDWDSLNLYRSDKEGEFIIEIVGRDKGDLSYKKSYRVSPVFRGQDYEIAFKAFKKNFDAYNVARQELQERAIALEKKKKKIEKEYNELSTASNYVFRTRRLGWINIDKIIPNPVPVEIIVNTEENKYDKLEVNLINLSRKTLLKAYSNATDQFYFSPGSTTVGLPLGDLVWVYATGFKEGQLYFALEKFRIKNKQNIALNFKPSSVEAVTEELALAINPSN